MSPKNEPVEEITVRLNLDADGFMDDYETEMEKAKGKAGELEGDWGGVGSGISEEMELINAAVGKMIEVATEAGLVVDAELVAKYKNFAVGLLDASGSVEEFSLALGQHLVAMKEQAPAVSMASVEMKRITTAFAAAKKAIPVSKLEKLNRELINIAVEGLKAGKSIKAIREEMRALANETIEKGTKEQSFTERLSGDFAAIVPRILGVIGVYKLLMTVIKKINAIIKESITLAISLSEANWQLQASVAAAQAVYGEAIGTQTEWKSLVEDLTTTYLLDQKAALKTVSVGVQLGAQFGIMGEELDKLIRGGVAFGTTYGKSLPQALERFIQFVGTGSGEFKELGINVEDSAIQAWMARSSFEGLYKELDATQQRAARLGFIMDALGPSMAIAETKADTLAGRFAALERETEKSKEGLGRLLAPLKLFLKQAELGLVNFIGLWVALWAEGLLRWTSSFVAIGLLAIETMVDIGEAASIMWDAISGESEGGIAGAWEAITGPRGPFGATRGNKITGLTEEYERVRSQLSKAFVDPLLQNLFGSPDENKAIVEGVTSAMGDVGKAIDKANLDFALGSEKITERLIEDQGRISEQFHSRRVSAAQKRNSDFAKIEAQAATQRSQAIAQNELDEYRMRQDHGLRMLELEESFLFNLEDAIMARDAKRVFMLQRQLEFDKRRENRDFAVRQSRRREDFQMELNEIAAQAALRKQQRQLSYLQELADLRAQEKETQAARIEQAERERTDLEERLNDRLELLGHMLMTEGDMTAEALAALKQNMLDAYGNQGWVLQILNGLGGSIQRAVRFWAANMYTPFGDILNPAIEQMMGGEGSFNTFGGGSFRATTTSTGRGVTQYARGGEFVAASPRTIQVGEVPERVTITPLSRLGGSGAERSGGDSRVHVGVDIGLDDGLVGTIVDKALDEAADVVINIASGGRSRR